MGAGPLVELTASIVQLRHEALVASSQRAEARARNVALVGSLQATLSSTLALQRRRRREVEEERAKQRLLDQRTESDALRAELEDVLERRERARLEFDQEVHLREETARQRQSLMTEKSLAQFDEENRAAILSGLHAQAAKAEDVVRTSVQAAVSRASRAAEEKLETKLKEQVSWISEDLPLIMHRKTADALQQAWSSLPMPTFLTDANAAQDKAASPNLKIEVPSSPVDGPLTTLGDAPPTGDGAGSLTPMEVYEDQNVDSLSPKQRRQAEQRPPWALSSAEVAKLEPKAPKQTSPPKEVVTTAALERAQLQLADAARRAARAAEQDVSCESPAFASAQAELLQAALVVVATAQAVAHGPDHADGPYLGNGHSFSGPASTFPMAVPAIPPVMPMLPFMHPGFAASYRGAQPLHPGYLGPPHLGCWPSACPGYPAPPHTSQPTQQSVMKHSTTQPASGEAMSHLAQNPGPCIHQQVAGMAPLENPLLHVAPTARSGVAGAVQIPDLEGAWCADSSSIVTGPELATCPASVWASCNADRTFDCEFGSSGSEISPEAKSRSDSAVQPKQPFCSRFPLGNTSQSLPATQSAQPVPVAASRPRLMQAGSRTKSFFGGKSAAVCGPSYGPFAELSTISSGPTVPASPAPPNDPGGMAPAPTAQPPSRPQLSQISPTAQALDVLPSPAPSMSCDPTRHDIEPPVMYGLEGARLDERRDESPHGGLGPAKSIASFDAASRGSNSHPKRTMSPAGQAQNGVHCLPHGDTRPSPASGEAAFSDDDAEESITRSPQPGPEELHMHRERALASARSSVSIPAAALPQKGPLQGDSLRASSVFGQDVGDYSDSEDEEDSSEAEKQAKEDELEEYRSMLLDALDSRDYGLLANLLDRFKAAGVFFDEMDLARELLESVRARDGLGGMGTPAPPPHREQTTRRSTGALSDSMEELELDVHRANVDNSSPEIDSRRLLSLPAESDLHRSPERASARVSCSLDVGSSSEREPQLPSVPTSEKPTELRIHPGNRFEESNDSFLTDSPDSPIVPVIFQRERGIAARRIPAPLSGAGRLGTDLTSAPPSTAIPAGKPLESGQSPAAANQYDNSPSGSCASASCEDILGLSLPGLGSDHAGGKSASSSRLPATRLGGQALREIVESEERSDESSSALPAGPSANAGSEIAKAISSPPRSAQSEESDGSSDIPSLPLHGRDKKASSSADIATTEVTIATPRSPTSSTSSPSRKVYGAPVLSNNVAAAQTQTFLGLKPSSSQCSKPTTTANLPYSITSASGSAPKGSIAQTIMKIGARASLGDSDSDLSIEEIPDTVANNDDSDDFD